MKYKPDWAKNISAVTPAHGGASYNPDYDAHQHLLRQEHEKESKRVHHSAWVNFFFKYNLPDLFPWLQLETK